MKIIDRLLDKLLPYRPMEREFEKRQEFFRRFLEEGWRPKLWEEGATDEEKTEAIIKYVNGGIPFEGLP